MGAHARRVGHVMYNLHVDATRRGVDSLRPLAQVCTLQLSVARYSLSTLAELVACVHMRYTPPRDRRVGIPPAGPRGLLLAAQHRDVFSARSAHISSALLTSACSAPVLPDRSRPPGLVWSARVHSVWSAPVWSALICFPLSALLYSPLYAQVCSAPVCFGLVCSGLLASTRSARVRPLCSAQVHPFCFARIRLALLYSCLLALDGSARSALLCSRLHAQVCSALVCFGLVCSDLSAHIYPLRSRLSGLPCSRRLSALFTSPSAGELRHATSHCAAIFKKR